MPSSRIFRILALGDVVGKPGRKALNLRLPGIIEECAADFVLINGENASGGLGITSQVTADLLSLPIDVITSGNHVWKHKELRDTLDIEHRLLRPANYPVGTPGRGSVVLDSGDGVPVGVLNLEGLLFMSPLTCPFRTADSEIVKLHEKTSLVVVDFHAEATSEKRALGHYLDGRITALVGTHTHIPTADAEVLPGGTGYLTDLGMCGPTDSVIGVRKEQAIARFTTRLPSPFQVARGRVQIQGAVISADPDTGRCLGIDRRTWPVD